jgi:hypothetical protein
MIECGGGTGFLLEAAKAFGIRGEGSRQNLDGDFALESRIMGAINLSHAARTE